MTDLYLLEPADAAAWAPFGGARPIAELRAGAWLIRERWEAIAEGESRAAFGEDPLHGFTEDGVPAVEAVRAVDGPALIGCSHFAPSGIRPEWPQGPARLTNDGAVVGWYVPAGARWTPQDAGQDRWVEVAIEGFPLHGAYDVVTALEHLLAGDAADFTHEGGDPVPDGCVVIGDPSEVVLLGAAVEPGVVFDVRHGAVVVEQHAYVRSGARLEGPLYVGPGTEILGGPVGHSSIGPRCKVRGEVTNVIFLGYANKAHEGFVGHSVVGRWCNLGAGTTTSNLKNTYGKIRLNAAGERIETGRMFLGTLFGDHVKLAIGTMLDTGSIVGAGANVFGTVRPPKFVPPFAWGVSGERMRRAEFLELAGRVMPRRNVQVTPDVRESLSRIYDYATR
jgi:UDP-N-acetylglucosamine diphosphorylase/glucosamine-1-phosphate N-acetyltransferase